MESIPSGIRHDFKHEFRQVSFHLSFQLLEATAGQVMRRSVIPPAVGALCRLVGLLEIGVQVGALMVLLCNRALALFKR